MLFYPSEIETKLEIDLIREFIKTHCKSEAAKERVDRARPFEKTAQLETFLQQTREMLAAVGSGGLPVSGFQDLFPFLKKIGTNGSFLEAHQLSTVKQALMTLYEWTQFLKKNIAEYPAMGKLTHGFIADRDLVDEIDAKIDENGEVRDNASPELSQIRRRILNAERQVRNVIHKVLEQSKKSEFTDEEGTVTIRDGRLVIPVKAEFKRKFAGFVHDESSTGQTVFMEPTEVLELNNEVRELRYAEKREIVRILTSLADGIRERLTDLEKGSEFLIRLDFIHAKAQFARSFDAVVPTIGEKGQFKIKGGRHPILWKRHKDAGKDVVPLDIDFSSEQRLIVISGPNAGGKSVALKTVGILQYMAQCGFPVTAQEDSVFSVFRNYFIDIGDSQSLENDLSTYSSHLKAMQYFSEYADKKTLVLIDEFGTGTEPQFGGAIAEAILASLNKARCQGVVTTHYSNLKDFAEKNHGVVNAAMRYDTDKLEPLFQLEIGKPGSSFAFEIATKIGIRKQILQEARKLVGADHVSYDRLLGRLDSEKAKFERTNKQLLAEKADVLQLRKDYEALKALVERDKRAVIKEAKAEAARIVDSANREVEKTIREIKEAQAEKSATKKSREKLTDFGNKMRKEAPKPKTLRPSEPKPDPELAKPIAVGDKVKVKGQETIGEVYSMKGKQAEVAFGDLKSFVTLSKLEKVSNRQAKKQQKAEVRLSSLKLDKKMSNFSHELDVRGKRAEEVLPLVDKKLDDALVLGIKELRVLHGKGHGILKDIIRNHLRDDNHVLSMADEHADRGGSGITIITLA